MIRGTEVGTGTLTELGPFPVQGGFPVTVPKRNGVGKPDLTEGGMGVGQTDTSAGVDPGRLWMAVRREPSGGRGEEQTDEAGDGGFTKGGGVGG